MIHISKQASSLFNDIYRCSDIFIGKIFYDTRMYIVDIEGKDDLEFMKDIEMGHFEKDKDFTKIEIENFIKQLFYYVEATPEYIIKQISKFEVNTYFTYTRIAPIT